MKQACWLNDGWDQVEVTARVVTVTLSFVFDMTPSRNKTCGNKGHFHGDPLEFLLENLPDYLALAPHKKGSFWDTFFPAWDAKYPKLESDELREELEREEAAYKAECEELKAANENEVRKRGRRKAVLQDFPATSDRLNELRACDAEQSVRIIIFYFPFLVGAFVQRLNRGPCRN
jgi:hypothetical protein